MTPTCSKNAFVYKQHKQSTHTREERGENPRKNLGKLAVEENAETFGGAGGGGGGGRGYDSITTKLNPAANERLWSS